MAKKHGPIKGWVIVGTAYNGKPLYFRNETAISHVTFSPLRAYVFDTRKQAIQKMKELKFSSRSRSYWHTETIQKKWVISSKELPKVYFVDKKEGFHVTTSLEQAMLFENEALARQTLYSFGALSACNHWKIEWV